MSPADSPPATSPPPSSVSLAGLSEPGARPWVLLMMAALACTVTALIWLTVIEVTNARAGDVLGELRGTEIHAWAPRVSSSADLRLTMAVDEAGDPLPEPLPPELAERIDLAYAEASIRQHLYNILRGFGPVGYLLAIGGLAAGLALIARFGGSARWIGLVAALACLGVIARMAWLGVLTRGLLTDWLAWSNAA